ncbi:hypothetical protein [Robertkochia solimangrovi]|uniref:hypothetical protein n=1 Tax=Robertkochia solimangrovi TaxID=2213046 RepID=UPI00117E3791|nr:hypothetical protein [Robertkochia solimangrovi]TRZ45221.1 hypothetical protein DMZ48_05590 [Robertkochia solimangrovi]
MSQLPTNLKQQGSKSLWLGSLVAFVIAISPYIFYLYEGIPDVKVWETPFFTFESNYNESVQVFAWVFLNKFVPLYLAIIWFLTCKHWWYHVILIPISMFIFQTITVVNIDIKYVDEMEFYYIIPVMMIVIPVVYLIRLKLFDKVVHGIDLKEIDLELKKYEEEEKHLEKEAKFYQS